MAQETITSVHNPQVKRMQQLLNRKGREEAGRFLVEGAHLVEEAFRSGARVHSVVYDLERGLDPASEAALRRYNGPVRRFAVSPQVFAKLAETRSPQGVLAEVEMINRDWDQWCMAQKNSNSPFFLLVLDELQDPGNLGTILRTAEAAGIDGVLLGENCVDLYNGKVLRSTMGAIFRLPIYRHSLDSACRQVKELGAKLLVTSLGETSVSYDAPLYDGRIAVVIGNEGRGVSEAIHNLASSCVHIPLYGEAESLNAAVACGIILYEARRQRAATY